MPLIIYMQYGGHFYQSPKEVFFFLYYYFFPILQMCPCSCTYFRSILS